MLKDKRTILGALLALVVAAAIIVIARGGVASATESECQPTDAVWANFAPNDNQGPFQGPPVWPVDERGTWNVHDGEIPGGHEGPDGVYQQGQGNSPWFYRQAGVECPEEPDPVLVAPSYSALLGCDGLFIKVNGVLVNPGAGETDQYTYTVSIFRGRIVQFEFVAKDGFVFESGPTLNDSRFLPVLRCMMPPDPEDPKDPKTDPKDPEVNIGTPASKSVPKTVPKKSSVPNAEVSVPTAVDAGLY